MFSTPAPEPTEPANVSEASTNAAPIPVRAVLTWDEEPWILHVDGSSNQRGSGAGLILYGPSEVKLEYALLFGFEASNNEAEYEALITGLNLAKEMGTKHLIMCSDSQQVVNQVNGDYETRDSTIAAYLTKAREILPGFNSCFIRQIQRSENAEVDALS
ncbi:PREDICTED: uncharacterized protein LOC104591315 [Nelumbo nucifera]|uniref:Uncharacterized protein LOC104591315 n=1 Tax=Nelumbo nucifera TaxID=4432 RepID=A0A1U7ZB92_NELNU|nr:PREDICTED: uncharacterized protein LOC104591315 [Nelumbo nucifera]